MIGRTNSGSGSNKNLDKSQLFVTGPTGSIITCTDGLITKRTSEKNNQWRFLGLDNGNWTINATLGDQHAVKKLPTIERLSILYEEINYTTIPTFSYTGEYRLVDEQDNDISHPETYSGNWKIKFLTSGDLVFINLPNDKIDIYLVGAGGSGCDGDYGSKGSGGGGGRTKTIKGILPLMQTTYPILIGPSITSSGKKTDITLRKSSAFNFSVDGGEDAGGKDGPHGYSVIASIAGSGGNGGGSTWNLGGRGGQEGTPPKDGGSSLDVITREFDVKTGKLYADGGDGGAFKTAVPGKAGEKNSGNGGNGGDRARGIPGGPGGSGIIIIRNSQEEA